MQNHLIEPEEGVGLASGSVDDRERFGGMLRYFRRQVA
jgi:hypothetical protein